MDSDEQPPLTNPVKAFKVLHSLEGEENYTSLSGFFDCEPNLEFDDSELSNNTGLAPLPPELVDVVVPDNVIFRSCSDGTIEENFEEELASAPKIYTQIAATSPAEDSCFEQLNHSGVLEIVGDDEAGRRIIVISACFLPNMKEVHPDTFFRYFTYTLDNFVEQDYSVVYFHYGLNSRNKPPASWLWKAYKMFDRKYKKNLKALYLVHPTNFIRVIWQMLRPAISVKFGRKVMYVNYLHELQQHLDLDKLCIPEQVLQYDELLLSKKRNVKAPSASTTSAETSQSSNSVFFSQSFPPTQQFGVTLQFIKENNTDISESIPPIVRQCVEYLSRPEALDTEGLFRRSANAAVIKELQSACNKGETISFKDDPHNAAVLLKVFLRDLEDPLMTYDNYDDILQFETLVSDKKLKQAQMMITQNLPLDNYKLLKYLIKFLWKVQDRSCINKMTSSNLAVVFGPNLVWPRNKQMSLNAITPINDFTHFILKNHEVIFFI